MGKIQSCGDSLGRRREQSTESPEECKKERYPEHKILRMLGYSKHHGESYTASEPQLSPNYSNSHSNDSNLLFYFH
ncbi:unnamed protein product [Rodentolepis nana]|uniref:Ovule protein n=1 Tax=Rodentolepis nana TaxID=102285 RepID=A0A0R3TG85_RODNA|nr:unnamed protein product [Rodentolepis nana]